MYTFRMNTEQRRAAMTQALNSLEMQLLQTMYQPWTGEGSNPQLAALEAACIRLAADIDAL